MRELPQIGAGIVRPRESYCGPRPPPDNPKTIQEISGYAILNPRRMLSLGWHSGAWSVAEKNSGHVSGHLFAGFDFLNGLGCHGLEIRVGSTPTHFFGEIQISTLRGKASRTGSNLFLDISMLKCDGDYNLRHLVCR